MLAPTFLRVLELPKDIQFQIWKEAVAQIPDQLAILDQIFYVQTPWQWISCKKPSLPIATLSSELSMHCLLLMEQMISVAFLAGTYVMSRQVMLEWWKHLAEEWMSMHDNPRLIHPDKCSKQELLDLLEECIQDVQGK